MTKQLKADLALILVTLFWGISFPLISVTLKQMPPYNFIFFRYGISAVILLLAVYKINKLKNMNLKSLKVAIYIGSTTGLGIIFQTLGLLYTTPSKSGFLTGLSVILIPIFMAFIYKKMPSVRTIIGIVLSLAGLFLMSMDVKNLDLTINKGDVLTLLSAVFFAIGILVVDRYISGSDVALISGLQFAVIGIMGFFPALFIEKISFNLSTSVIVSILIASLFCTIFAYGVQNMAQRYTSPVHVAVIFLLEPVFSALFSVFVGDSLSGTMLIGCVFILVGMFVVSVKNEVKVDKARKIEKDIGYSND